MPHNNWTTKLGPLNRPKPLRNSGNKLHLSNRYYGHSCILADHSGVKSDTPIHGVFQHGAFIYSAAAHFGKSFNHLRFFVWNEAVAFATLRDGVKEVNVIGSPLVYLTDRSVPIRRLDVVSEPRLLLVPSHGLLHGDCHSSIGDFLERSKHFGLQRAAVMLHANEFGDPSIRDLVTGAGHTPVSCWRDKSSLYDLDFIPRLLKFLSEYDILIWDSPSTAFFYALYLGLDARILLPASGGLNQEESLRCGELGTEYRSFMMWPSNDYDLDRCRREAVTELGFEHKKSSEELKQLLGFDDPFRQTQAKFLQFVLLSRLRFLSLWRDVGTLPYEGRGK